MMTKRMDFTNISTHKGPGSSPGFLMWKVSTAWRSSIEQALRMIDLTHPQFVILATLGWLTKDGSPTTQANLGCMAKLDPNTVSQIIRSLEKKELILRKQSSDARAKNPILTKKGVGILTQAIPIVEAKDKAFFSTLSGNELECTLTIFRKLIDEKL